MRRGTNLPAVGGFNQTVILDAIRRAPHGVSRVEIARATGLSAQTIANAVRRLLDDGLIVETGMHISGPGRPRVILELDPDSRFAVGVHLDPTIVTYVVLDLSGRVVAHERARTPKVISPDVVVATMAEAITSIIAAANVPASRIVGVGIASPGPIDLTKGTVVDPPLLEGWKDVPLRDAIGRATGLPVALEKDVTAAIVAELWTGGERMSGDFAFLYYGTGIGVGLALRGEVYPGVTGNAGDGGTLVVPSVGLPEHRKSEMLGHLATPQFLVSQAVDAGVLSTQPPERDLAALDDAFSELVAIADQGDRGAVEILDRAAGFIASGLVSTINLLDIDEVVFGGPAWARVSARFRERIEEAIDSSSYRMIRNPVRLRDSQVGEDVAAVGAACLALDSAFSPRPSALLISER